jgi:hypothetical protein
MADLEQIKTALERLETNMETDADRQMLVQALREKVITIESGQRSVAVGGHIGNSVIVTGNGNVIHVIKPSTAEALSLATKPAIIAATGRWATQELTNPFDKHDKFRLHFDLEVKGDTLLGTVRQVSTRNRYDVIKGILDGRIKDNIISFCTIEQSSLGDKEFTYKNYYHGSVLKDEVEFTLQSDRPWGFPPQKFTAKREQSSGP